MCQRCGDKGRSVVLRIPLIDALTVRYMAEIMTDRLLWEALDVWHWPADRKSAAFQVIRRALGCIVFQASMRSYVRNELTK